MTTIKQAAVMAAMALAPGLVQAEFLTGEALLRMLGSRSQSDQDQALGYIVGVYDATRGTDHCGPATTQVGALRSQTLLMLRQVGALRALSADVLVRAMLRIDHPCEPDVDERNEEQGEVPAPASSRTPRRSAPMI